MFRVILALGLIPVVVVFWIFAILLAYGVIKSMLKEYRASKKAVEKACVERCSPAVPLQPDPCLDPYLIPGAVKVDPYTKLRDIFEAEQRAGKHNEVQVIDEDRPNSYLA